MKKFYTALFMSVLVAFSASTAHGQFRSPKAPLRSRAVTKPARPAPKTLTKPTAPKVNGNSKRSNRPQHLYKISATKPGAGTRVVKDGLSGGRLTFKNNKAYSSRAQRQVNALNKAAKAKGDATRYRARVTQQIAAQAKGKATARQQALYAERQAVTKHAAKRGKPPVMNSRPTPHPHSRVGIKSGAKR